MCDDTVVGSVDTGHCVYDVVLKFGPSCEAFTVDIESLCEWCLTVHVDEVPKHWVVLWLQFGSCLGAEEVETLQKHDCTAQSDTGGRVSALSQRSALGSWTENQWTSSAIWRQSWGSVRPVLYSPFPFLVYLVTRNTTTIPNRLDKSVTHNRTVRFNSYCIVFDEKIFICLFWHDSRQLVWCGVVWSWLLLQVDYASDPVMLLKPNKVVIRRSFQYGIWLQHRTSAHQTQLHMMLHRLQVSVCLSVCLSVHWSLSRVFTVCQFSI